MTDISYNLKVRCTSKFLNWISKIDRSLKIRIDQRIQRMTSGNPGFHKRFDSILELKWKTGPIGSLRVYCAETDGFILLMGGHKDTQNKDIETALHLLKGINNGKTRVKVYESIFRR